MEKTTYTPQITFDTFNHIFTIEGKSYPENTFDFYKGILEWLTIYFNNTSLNKTLTINIELIYLNSSSLKSYFEMFDIFEEAAKKGLSIKINWIYESDDDIMEEIGEDFMDSFKDLNINLISKD
jgi:hypothetical protein